MSLDQASFFQCNNEIAPWDDTQPVCDWTLTKCKASVAPTVILQEFYELRHKYSDYTECFSDGSKTASFVGCAVFSEALTSAQRIASSATIFNAELYGVLAGVKYIKEHHISEAILYVDSQSVLLAICLLHISKNRLVHKVR